MEERGCWPATVNTIAAYILIFMWSIIIGMITIVYAGWSSELSSSILDISFTNYMIFIFLQASIHRHKPKTVLKSGPNITTGHDCRLMAACMVKIAFTVPLGVYSTTMTGSLSLANSGKIYIVIVSNGTQK